MKPLSQILLSIVLAFIIAQMGFSVVNRGVHKYYVHKDERLKELFLNNTNFDVLFIGSSRTHTSINPKVIDSICVVNSYNAGVEGGNLLEFKLTFEAYLQAHPPPSLLVLTLDINSFDLTRKFFNFSQYFPYTKNRSIDKALKENGHSTGLVKIFPFIQLTNYDDYTKANAIKGLNGKTEIPQGDFQYKGYLSNSEKVLRDTQLISSQKQVHISQEAIAYLREMISACDFNGVKLIFAYAPEFKKKLQNQFSNKNEVFALLNDMAAKNNIPYFRDDDLILCQNPKLFANIGHLNTPGANEYSLILAKKINNEKLGSFVNVKNQCSGNLEKDL